MDKMRFNKSELLQVINKNREEHIKTYEEAVAGYKGELIKCLEAMVQMAKEDKAYFSSVEIKRPESHVEDYDNVIQMLEMCTDEEILLTDLEFRHYIRDQWHWQEHFLMSNSKWSASAREKSPLYTMGSANPHDYDLSEGQCYPEQLLNR